MSNYLPVHMQHITGRMGVEKNTFKALKENNFKDRPFANPISYLNTRKDFNFKGQNTHTKVSDGTKKRNLTFN